MKIIESTTRIKEGNFSDDYLSKIFKRYPNMKHKIFRLYPQYSLTALTEGRGFVRGISNLSSNGQVANMPFMEWELLGEENTICNFVAGSDTGATLGQNFSSFNICLDEDYFNQGDVGKLENDATLYFETNAVPLTTGVFRYKVRLETASATDSISDSLIAVGKRIEFLYPIVGEYSDIGYLKSRRSKERFREYATTFRTEYTLSGHAAAKQYLVMDDVSGQKFFISELDKMLLEKAAMFKENILMFGKSTVDANGETKLIDSRTRQKISKGNGLENQLSASCRTFYNSSPSVKLIKDIISEYEYRTKADKKELILMTGSRGKKAFMETMEDLIKPGDNVYSVRNGNEITIGGNFSKFIYGDTTITITVNTALDNRYTASPLDDEGYPLSSSKMYFIDNGTYDGEKNLTSFHEDSKSLVINEILGVGGKDGKSSGQVSSSVHAYKKVAMGSIGLRVLNQDSSIIVEKI